MVKIIRLVSGEEICCIIPKEQVKDKSHLLRLSEPMLIKYVPQITEFGISDYIALVKWVGFTNDKIITIPKDKILTITNACAEVIKSYNDIKQEYNRPPVKPDSKKYIREKFSDDENRKINEIFNFYDDGDDTLH